ncbi:MAG: hypothetical protein K0S07_1685 [Chlamydiales bacterium]|jgi:hypothetical protein|nr:hypothetical protein [Chlamydiales bacterium]
MLFSTLLLADEGGGWILKDYKGGAGPDIIPYLQGLGVLIVLIAIIAFIYHKLRWVRFYRLCRKKGLTPLEENLMYTFVRKLNIQNEAEVLNNIKEFHSFLNRVAHFYEGLESTVGNAATEVALFDKITEKIAAAAPPIPEGMMTSSRDLKVSTPVIIFLEDKESKNIIFFQSEILENHAFSLAIATPSLDLQKDGMVYKKPSCEIYFFKDDSSPISFHSVLASSVDGDKEAWCIRHSQKLVKEEVLVPVQAEGNVLFSKGTDQAMLDADAQILSISQKWCLLQFKAIEELPRNLPAVISFKLGQSPMALRGLLTDFKRVGDNAICRIYLKKLSTEDQMKVRHYMKSVRKQ